MLHNSKSQRRDEKKIKMCSKNNPESYSRFYITCKLPIFIFMRLTKIKLDREILF